MSTHRHTSLSTAKLIACVAGWFDWASSWDRKVWCFQGLQNFYLCVLVDTAGELFSCNILQFNTWMIMEVSWICIHTSRNDNKANNKFIAQALLHDMVLRPYKILDMYSSVSFKLWAYHGRSYFSIIIHAYLVQLFSLLLNINLIPDFSEEIFLLTRVSQEHCSRTPGL